MKKIPIILVAACALISSGCATMFKGGGQTVQFESVPEGATCEVSRPGDGVLYGNITTPRTITVVKDNDPLVVTCMAEGYEDVKEYIPSDFEGTAILSIIFGGPIGIVIDWATGAMWKYPGSYTIPMKPLAE